MVSQSHTDSEWVWRSKGRSTFLFRSFSHSHCSLSLLIFRNLKAYKRQKGNFVTKTMYLHTPQKTSIPFLPKLSDKYIQRGKKKLQTKCWQRCRERWTLIHSWAKLRRVVKKINMEVSENIKNRTTIWLKFLSTSPKNSISYYRSTCSSMLIATLVIIGRKWKQFSCPQNDGYTTKIWYMCTMDFYLVK